MRNFTQHRISDGSFVVMPRLWVVTANDVNSIDTEGRFVGVFDSDPVAVWSRRFSVGVVSCVRLFSAVETDLESLERGNGCEGQGDRAGLQGARQVSGIGVQSTEVFDGYRDKRAWWHKNSEKMTVGFI